MVPGTVQRATLFDPQTRLRTGAGEMPSIRANDLKHFFGEGEFFNNNAKGGPAECKVW